MPSAQAISSGGGAGCWVKSAPLGLRDSLLGEQLPVEGVAVQVAAERGEREDLPVQVVVDGEVPGEAGAGKIRLVPGAVLSLGVGQPLDAALDGPGLLLPG